MKNFRKNTDAQHMLPAHIPWYRRRMFWGVIFGIFFLFSISLFFFLFKTSHASYSSVNIISGLIMASGGILFDAIISKSINNHTGGLVYIFVVVFLIYKTFSATKVQLRYPIIFTVLYTSGLYVGAMLMGI